jgi:Fic family protein
MASYIESAQKGEALKKELDGLMPMKREDEDRLWKKLRLEWNYNSNHIEGNTLTYHETELYLIFDQTTGNHSGREYNEMKAHDVAVELVKEWANDGERDITEYDIRTLNKTILVEPYWKEAETADGQKTQKQIQIGQYKQLPNSVRLRSGKMHQFASPEETPAKMTDLMDWYYNQSKNLQPFHVAAYFHHQFVSIHPFDDGNGRVARLVMNFILLKAGYPPVIIKAKDKENYYAALRKADAKDEASFMGYITDQLIWSLELSIKAAKGESIEELDDVEKELILLTKELFLNSINLPEKSPELCQNLLQDVVRPISIQVVDAISTAKDFFLNTKAELKIDSGLSSKTLSENTFRDQSSFAVNAETYTSGFETAILEIIWAGYKLNPELNENRLTSIIIQGKPNSYDIYYHFSNLAEPELILKNPYEIYPSDLEIQNLIHRVKKDVLLFIKYLKNIKPLF